MSVLALLHGAQIANGEVIDADDLKDNFNQLINLFNGTSNNIEAVTKLSSPTVAPLTLNQLNAAGPVLAGQLNGTDVFRFLSDGDLNIGGQITNLAGNGLPELFAANPTTDNQAVRRKYITDILIGWSGSWVIADPSAAALNTEEYVSIIVPSVVNNFKITHIRIEYRNGSHTPGGSVTFKVSQRGSVNQELGTIVLDNTNNTPFVLYTSDIADVTLAALDRLVLIISARSGTVSERDVSIFVEGTRTLV